jgi:hypothetical protein
MLCHPERAFQIRCAAFGATSIQSRVEWTCISPCTGSAVSSDCVFFDEADQRTTVATRLDHSLWKWLSQQFRIAAVLPLIVSLLTAVILVVGVILTIHVFHSRRTKPDLGETVVAIAAGLGAAVLAGMIGFVAAVIACSALLTGEAGEAGLIVGPCAALVFAMAGFVLTVRLVFRHGDPPADSSEHLG